jgi:hypothetical protein
MLNTYRTTDFSMDGVDTSFGTEPQGFGVEGVQQIRRTRLGCTSVQGNFIEATTQCYVGAARC